MGKHIIDRIRHPDVSVQYEIQRMDHNGGWQSIEGVGPFDEPPEKPAAPRWGRYRCIKRVDGHYHSDEWTLITEGATEKYKRKREREKQLDRIKDLQDEIQAQQESGDDEDDFADRILEAAVNGDLDNLSDSETLEGLGRLLESRVELEKARGDG